MSTLLRRLGLLLVLLANRIEQRSPLTLALEPLAPVGSFDETVYEIRHRNARYY
jgi:hypothetical protein